MNDANRELHDVFALVAAALGYQGEAWVKIRAYKNFADQLAEMDGSIDDVADPSSLPGVGKAIDKKVRQWRADRTFPLWERIHEQVPADVLAMLQAGLPPATVKHLETAGYGSVAELEAAGEDALQYLPSRHRAPVREWLTRRR